MASRAAGHVGGGADCSWSSALRSAAQRAAPPAAQPAEQTRAGTLTFASPLRGRAVLQERNPFKFRHVQTLRNAGHFISDYSGPCVVMATPSGLQSGASRDFFEAWWGLHELSAGGRGVCMRELDLGARRCGGCGLDLRPAWPARHRVTPRWPQVRGQAQHLHHLRLRGAGERGVGGGGATAEEGALGFTTCALPLQRHANLAPSRTLLPSASPTLQLR
jgi:hypothetical protein